MTSHIRISSNTKNLELTLDGFLVKKEALGVVKKMRQNDELVIVPTQNKQKKASELMDTIQKYSGATCRRSCVNTQKPVQKQYVINNNQVTQMIWKSALVAKNMRGTDRQLSTLACNKLVGEENQLDAEIQKMSEAVRMLKNKFGRRHSKVEKANQLMLRLVEEKEKVRTKWKEIREDHERILKQNFQNPHLSLYRPNLSALQKAAILPFIRDQLIQMDIKLLADSVFFVVQLNQHECFVTLQNPYYSFQGLKSEVMEVIGEKDYKACVEQFFLWRAKEKSRMNNYSIKFCHKCLDIKVKNNTDFICMESNRRNDPYLTPFAHLHTLFHSDYSFIQTIQKNKSIPERIGSFELYCHPYYTTLTTTCGRLICQKCSQEYRERNSPQENKEEEEEADVGCKDGLKKIAKNKKATKCFFCYSICQCSRCMLADKFNKFAAFYQTFGGDFIKEVVPHLRFQNCQNQNSSFQHVPNEYFSKRWKEVLKMSAERQFKKYEVEFKIRIELFKEREAQIQQNKVQSKNRSEEMVPEESSRANSSEMVAEQKVEVGREIGETLQFNNKGYQESEHNFIMISSSNAKQKEDGSDLKEEEELSDEKQKVSTQSRKIKKATITNRKGTKGQISRSVESISSGGSSSSSLSSSSSQLSSERDVQLQQTIKVMERNNPKLTILNEQLQKLRKGHEEYDFEKEKERIANTILSRFYK